MKTRFFEILVMLLFIMTTINLVITVCTKLGG